MTKPCPYVAVPRKLLLSVFNALCDAENLYEDLAENNDDAEDRRGLARNRKRAASLAALVLPYLPPLPEVKP